MILNLRRALVASVVFLVLCGLLYPLAGTGISQLFFARQANGSLTPYGSSLIGQVWTGPGWFHGRPDGSIITTGPGGVLVSGTNQPGPRSKALASQVAKTAQTLKREGVIPTNDLVTTSGSLLDPDISPRDAFAQMRALSAARSVPESQLRRLIDGQIHGKLLGFIGRQYVDVLSLNIALSRLK